MSIQVLIADDRGVIRQGLRTDLGSNPGFEFVGEARDGAEAVRNRHYRRIHAENEPLGIDPLTRSVTLFPRVPNTLMALRL